MYPLVALAFSLFPVVGEFLRAPTLGDVGIIFAVCWSAERIVAAINQGKKI